MGFPDVSDEIAAAAPPPVPIAPLPHFASNAFGVTALDELSKMSNRLVTVTVHTVVSVGESSEVVLCLVFFFFLRLR